MASLSTLHSAALRCETDVFIDKFTALWTDYIMLSICVPYPEPVKVMRIFMPINNTRIANRSRLTFCRMWARPRSNPLHWIIGECISPPTGFLSSFYIWTGAPGDRTISMASEMWHACPTQCTPVCVCVCLFECNFSEMEIYNNNQRKKLQPLMAAIQCTRVSGILCAFFVVLFTCALFRLVPTSSDVKCRAAVKVERANSLNRNRIKDSIHSHARSEPIDLCAYFSAKGHRFMDIIRLEHDEN